MKLMKAICYATIAVLSVLISVNCDNYVFEITQLNNSNVLPSLSNGHIGFVVYSDSVHLNGLYNGRRGESHRARVPNYARVEFEYCGSFPQNGNICTYTLDMRRGVFTTKSFYANGLIDVALTTYPHRYFDKTIVNHLTVNRVGNGFDGNAL